MAARRAAAVLGEADSVATLSALRARNATGGRTMKEHLPAGLRKSLGALARRVRGTQVSMVSRVSYTVPRQVVLVTARHDGAENVWPVDSHMRLSANPDLYGIAAYRSGYGAQLVRESGVFVVNFVPATWESSILYCGSTSGRSVDKFALAGLRKEEAETVDAPRLADSLGALECKVQQTIEVGGSTLFVGEVTHAILRKQAPRLHYIDNRLLKTASDWEAHPESPPSVGDSS